MSYQLSLKVAENKRYGVAYIAGVSTPSQIALLGLGLVGVAGMRRLRK